jgi:hypothetical protein
MQPSQQDHLKQLIERSTILSPAEKAEWLDMLILMNDKQASELEAILVPPSTPASPKPVSQPTAAPVAPVLPKLSHISNLPIGIEQVQPPPKSAPASAASQRPPFIPVAPEGNKVAAPKPPVSPVDTRIQSAPPRPATNRSTTPVASPGEVSPLETLADVEKLNVTTMRKMAHQDLLIRLQQLAKMEGYFNLLSYLEDSPLYRSYVATGKKILSQETTFDQGVKRDPALLSKEEFEQFIDILRKIQIN